MSSLSFLTYECSEERNAFFTYCWVIVDPPRGPPIPSSASTALPRARMSNPLCFQNSSSSIDTVALITWVLMSSIGMYSRFSSPWIVYRRFSSRSKISVDCAPDRFSRSETSGSPIDRIATSPPNVTVPRRKNPIPTARIQKKILFPRCSSAPGMWCLSCCINLL